MSKIDEFFKKGLYTNKGTIKTYRSHLNKYFEIMKCNPEDYFTGKRDFEADIMAYWEYLNSSPPMTKRSAMSIIKKYLCKYDKTIKELDIWDTVAFRLRGAEPISEEYIPETNDLKKIMLHMDIRTKAVALIAVSSGMRIDEIMHLLPSDMHLEETPARINIRSEISKNNKRRTTFISTEAKNVLDEWLRKNEEGISTRDIYLKTAVEKCNCNYKKNPNDKRIFPYTNNTVRYAWNLAIKKAGYGNKDIRTKRRKLHFHCARKFFRSYFGNADMAEHLMGHSGYLSTYRRYIDKQLAAEYLKNMDNLLVFEQKADVSGIQEQLKEKDTQIQELRDQMQMLMAKVLTLDDKEKKDQDKP